jgi:hypothetical protein
MVRAQSKRTSSRRAGRTIAVALLTVSGGCALFSEQKLVPTEHTAVLRSGVWGGVYRGGTVEAVAINGNETGWRLRKDVQVAAGEAVPLFWISLCDGSAIHCNPIAHAELKTTLAPGHSYLAHAKEQGNGTNRFRVWLTDETSGAVVSEAETPN